MVAVDETDRPMAFSAVTGSNMDALFGFMPVSRDACDDG
jgi:hypothetical protein